MILGPSPAPSFLAATGCTTAVLLSRSPRAPRSLVAMNSSRASLVQRLHRLWQTQVQLWEGHAGSHDVTGMQALRALHELRWVDGELRGQFLPEDDEETCSTC